MSYKKNYYYNLLHKFPEDIPPIFENQINLDLGRTYPRDPFFKDKNNISKLKNVLIAFSRREATIGYCQGFNFIVGKILKICKDEVNKYIEYMIFIYRKKHFGYS